MVKIKNANVGREVHGEEGRSSRGGHMSSILNMHSFLMLVMHEHRKMNFGYIAIEHMLATQSSSTKCLPNGCFLTKVFQHFKITFFGPNDHIRIGKIYNQNTFKRIGFSRNEDGRLIRGGQEEDSGNSQKRRRRRSLLISMLVLLLSLYRTKKASLKSEGYTLRRKDLSDQGKMKEKRSSP
ncbi:hypothetical protein M9H77_26644 [Catharanthus roseus]|uniref:Uncharacterized protein n=1 Tax=Catharanthus roseus TaxID=4058 RepID=A0ACC0AAR0_CATRO|nr:hypothetical protein M9H77_26644 [Catharanthus roseus]